MIKKTLTILLAFCFIISLLPSAAFAETAQTTEFVAIDKQYIKSLAEDERTINFKRYAPKANPEDILSVENGYIFFLAEKVTEGSTVKYMMLEDPENVKCVEEGVSIASFKRDFWPKNFNMYNEGNDEFTTYVTHIYVEEVGTYTLEYKGQQVKIDVKLPEYGFYNAPEASIENQCFGTFRYDPDAEENAFYMIVTEPEKYRNIEFFAHTEEMAAAVTIEQSGEYGEIGKIIINEPLPNLIIRCKREFKSGEWDASGNGMSIVQKPSKAVVKSLKTSAKHQITVKWNAQKAYGYHVKVATNSKFTKNVKNYYVEGTTSKTVKKLTKGKKYYVKVRAYNIADDRYYGSWSKTKSIVCK